VNQSAVRRSRVRWGLAVGLIELATLLAIAVLPAFAHATLLSASPAPGEVAPPTLKDITITFDSLLSPGNTVVMFSGTFLPVPGIVSQVERGQELAVHFPAPLLPGTYTVQWTAVTFDGHSVEGSYQFGVSKASGVSPWVIWLPVTAGVMVIAGTLMVGWGWLVRLRIRRSNIDNRNPSHYNPVVIRK
jgi:methionine-rich copper-binding protein CopC